MVGADQLAAHTLSRRAVDGVAENLSVAVDDAALAREKLVLGMDVKRVGLLLGGPQLAAEVFAVNLQAQLIGVGGVVSHAVVYVVV